MVYENGIVYNRRDAVSYSTNNMPWDVNDTSWKILSLITDIYGISIVNPASLSLDPWPISQHQ